MSDLGSSDALLAANGVRRSLAEAARMMRSLREDHGVSASKLSALGQLHRAGGPISAGELARREKLQPQSVTRIIAELDAAGLIVRSPNASDRRQSDLALSDQGRELLARDARRQNQWLAEAMARELTPAEQAILILAAELLERLVEDQTDNAR